MPCGRNAYVVRGERFALPDRGFQARADGRVREVGAAREHWLE